MIRKALILGAVGGLCLGLGSGVTRSLGSPLIAIYAALLTLALAAALALLGLLLAIPPRTRPAGASMVVTGLLLFATSSVSSPVLVRAGLSGDRMVRVGPQEVADLVLLFDSAASDREIADFVQAELIDGAPSQAIQSTLAVSVGHRRGYAITFHASATAPAKDALGRQINASSLVCCVFENVAPAQIQVTVSGDVSPDPSLQRATTGRSPGCCLWTHTPLGLA